MYVGECVCVEHVTLRRCALIVAALTARSAAELTHGGGWKIFHSISGQMALGATTTTIK